MDYWWLLIFAVFVFLEAVTSDLVSIWFAAGALAAFLVSSIVGRTVSLLVFLVVSLLTLVFFRKLVAKKTQSKIEKTNLDRLEGTEAYVEESIDNLHAKGRVRANGTSWLARSEDPKKLIEKDTVVEIVRIEGVKLIVKLPEKN